MDTTGAAGATGEADPSDGAPDRPALSRRKLLLIVGPIVVLAIVGTVATALTPTLAAHHPLLLIILEARNRNLVLARHVSIVPFAVVAVARRMLTDPLYYLLGWFYGDRAVRWLEVKAGMGSYARLMERIFKKASYPAVFLFPGAIVCALAGVVGMRFSAFAVVNLAGTIAAVTVLRVFGDILAGPVDALIGFFDDHLVLTTSISIGLVLLSVWAGRLQGRMEMSLKDIDELEAMDPAKPTDGAPTDAARAEGSDVHEGVEPDGQAGPAGNRLDG